MWLLINEVKRHTWTLTLKTKRFILTLRLKKSKQNNLMRLQVRTSHGVQSTDVPPEGSIC